MSTIPQSHGAEASAGNMAFIFLFVYVWSVDSAAAATTDEGNVSTEPGETRVQLPSTS